MRPYLSRLGSAPDWSRLDAYQHAITRDEFVYLLEHCYAAKPSAYQPFLSILSDRVLIRLQSNDPAAGLYTLHFAQASQIPIKRQRFWRKREELPRQPDDGSLPLRGLRVAVDPGHIGGDWTKWDDRDFQIGRHTLRIREGEMTLKVAKILQRDLTRLGATIGLTRESNNPRTSLRPEDLQDEARQYLIQRNRIPSSKSISFTASQMFAISSEIDARADWLNKEFQPDVALCLHFDAAPFPNPLRPSFVRSNYIHMLINGTYSEGEIKEDDSRLEMLLRILQGVYYSEEKLASLAGDALQKETRLPVFSGYGSSTAQRVNDNPMVWARNLKANRAFLCPTLFFEPHCMNNILTYRRVQAGEYAGLREFDGIYRKNIYQEYADGIAAALVKYYGR